MFIIILPLTPRLQNAEKFYQKVLISLQNWSLKIVGILTFFKELFSMLPQALDHKWYTISESYFDVLQGGKVNRSLFRSF